MLDTDTSSSEPSLVDSVIRVFEAGQRLVLDRVDLARFDLQQLADRALHGAALIAVGAVMLAGAWFTLMGGAVVWLQQYLPLPASLALVAGVSAGVGAAAIAIGTRRAQGDGGLNIAADLGGSLRGASHTANAVDGGRQP